MTDKLEILEKYNFWNGTPPPVGYKRSEYTNKISSYIGNRLIKVVIGQRRVGKSYILRQLALQLIENGTNNKNIFFINCELTDFDFLDSYQDFKELFNLYVENLKPQGRVYLFIDEIQNIHGWEKFINSLSQDYTAEYEVFISGSNSKLLSGELATLLSGRYVKFEILPFSYNEFCEISGLENSKSSYVTYMQNSGLPELTHLTTQEIRKNYVSALKDTILLRDIIQRNNIKSVQLLEDVFIYLINNASNLISIKNIVNYFKHKGRKTSYDTVANYISYMESTFLVHKAERYNIKGKDTISGLAKYYINDLAFNNFLYQGFGYGTGYLLENMIYLELRRAGFEVYVGSIKSKEVDFVAINGDKTVYVQSSYLLINKETITREYNSLELIANNYTKVVVSLDDIKLPDKEGIKHVQAWEFSNFLKNI